MIELEIVIPGYKPMNVLVLKGRSRQILNELVILNEEIIDLFTLHELRQTAILN